MSQKLGFLTTVPGRSTHCQTSQTFRTVQCKHNKSDKGTAKNTVVHYRAGHTTADQQSSKYNLKIPNLLDQMYRAIIVLLRIIDPNVLVHKGTQENTVVGICIWQVVYSVCLYRSAAAAAAGQIIMLDYKSTPLMK